MSQQKVTAIVPIRSGSKSIPDKNIRLLAGKPLFYWATRAAIDSGIFNGGVYVAVDSQKYFEMVKEVVPDAIPVMRPEATATDTATSESVLVWFSTIAEFDVLSLVQVTSPLVTSDDFRSAYEQFLGANADSLVTGVDFHRFIWSKNGTALNYDPLKRPRRQDMEPQVVENGAFYFTKRSVLDTYSCRLGGKIAVYTMSKYTSVELDEPDDWDVVSKLIISKGDTSVQDDVENLKVMVVDVDGTLTDGGMYYGPEGEAFKKFNTRDGAALSEAMSVGFRVLVCTGENSPSVRARIAKLGVPDILEGVRDKVEAISNWLLSEGYEWQNVVYVGDELNDLESIRRASVSFCPSDAHPEVKAIAKFVVQSRGGDGVIRDVMIKLKAIGKAK